MNKRVAVLLVFAAAAFSCQARPPLDGARAGSGGTADGPMMGAGGCEMPRSPVDVYALHESGAATTCLVDAGSDARGAGTDAAGDAGGAGGAGTVDVCGQLMRQYAESVVAAKACDPTSSVPQCGQLVIDRLSSCNCSTFVNDTSMPYMVRRAWDAIPCPVPEQACGPRCPLPPGARCVATVDGRGMCTDGAP